MTHAELSAPVRKAGSRAGGRSRAHEGAPLAARLESTLDKVETALALPDPTKMIHDARKAIKEYRALLRIMSGNDAKAARRAAAAAARELSSSRDLQACRDALADIREAGRLGTEDAARITEALGTDPSGEAGAATGHQDGLRAWLRKARADHAAGLDAQAAATDVLKGIREGYSKARDAADFSEPERLHDARKRVVTHRYQMSFLADLPGGAGARRSRRAQNLRDVLGTYQDIETLKHRLPQLAGALPRDLRDRLSEAAGARQEELVRKARVRHAHLFRRKPGAFTRRLADKVAKASRAA